VSRLLALVGAIAMIVVAIVVRGAIDDDDGGGRAGGDGGERVVVCVTELRTYCPSDGIVEDAGRTADRLAGGEDVDAWLTFDPWPSIVDDARTRAGLEPLFLERTGLASSPLVAVGPADRGDCDWACLASDPDLRVGSRPFDTSGLGLLHLGAIASGVVGTPAFATNDLVPEVRSTLARTIESTEASGDPVRQLLQSRAFFDVALSVQAEAQPALDAASADRRAGLALLYPAPVANAVVVAAGDARLLPGVSADLMAAGWGDGGVDAALPSFGVLAALRGLA